MADTKLADLASGAPAAATDLVYAVKDPSGTPTDAKLTLGEVKTLVVGAGSVSVASAKTLTASNTLTLAGTDGTTMTFPSTSATLARTDAANTFTGNQTLGSSDQLLWSTDLILTRRAAANLRFGAADAAAPVAQTLSVQSVVAGQTDVAGANLTITGSQGTGTGAGGSIIFQVAPAGSSGTAQNALVDALTISSTDLSVFPNASSVLLNVGNGGNRPLVIGSNQAIGNVGAFGKASLQFGWSSTSNPVGTPDLILVRDAANTLAQRNGTNAQAFRMYNTYTSSTDFERANIFWDSNVLKIGTEKGSVGGTARALELQTDGTTRLTIAAAAGTITGAVFKATAYFDAPAGALNSSGGIYFGVTGTGAQIQATAVGVLALANYAGSDFNRLQFGGTTSSFPALKRSSASLIVRLADDTANAALESASLKTDAPTGGTAATWKLGTVASVTPTLQNRTIEVDIGGTIYYLSAKTTND